MPSLALRTVRGGVGLAALLAALATTLALSFGCEQQAGAGASDPEFERVVADATASGKVVVATFTADWCAPCKRMESTTWTDADLRAWLDENAVRVLINIDKRRQLAQAHGIRSIPATVVFDGETELGRVVGFREAGDMRTFFDGLMSRRAPAAGG